MQVDQPEPLVSRRSFLRGAAAVGALATAPGLLSACSNAGGATPTASGAVPGQVSGRGKIKIGFIALTDCSSVVMAHELGLYAKHGVDVEVVKQASWAATRDNLLNGDIQAAHCLFGMPFSVYTGVGGTAGKELPIAMGINVNGQAITLA
jgi:nitrate/nitrite transport system substrate-binding protein